MKRCPDFYGKHHTEETKGKLREANTGRKMSQEFKKRVSEQQSKPIMANGRKYNSIKEASIELEIPYATLNRWVRLNKPGYREI